MRAAFLYAIADRRAQRRALKFLSPIRHALLAAEQIRDGFRAGGYAPEGVDTYARAKQKRIAALGTL